QLMRALGTATYGGGAEGEIFHARRLVDDEAPERWSTAFASIGERVRALGERAERKRHIVSAREHFLRASMYYRAAEYFADPFGEEGRMWGLASRATFIAGTRHLAGPDRTRRHALRRARTAWLLHDSGRGRPQRPHPRGHDGLRRDRGRTLLRIRPRRAGARL